MTEAPNSESQAKSENIKMELKEFLKDASFGDPKYQAFHDWSLQSGLTDDLVDARKEMEGKTTPTNESHLRVLKFRKALLDHEIEQKKISLSGYEHAYWTVWGSFDNLGGALYNEGRNKYPNDSAAIDQYVDENWNDFKLNALPDLNKGEPKATP